MTSRRERYERANMRGGMGVRKRLSEDSLKTSYRLNGVQTGSAVARCRDKYGRWEFGYYMGIIVRRTASVVQIKWWPEEDIHTYNQGDARYEVDRGRWKILGILRGNPLNPDDPMVDALTEMLGNYRMLASAGADYPAPTTEENEEMAEKSHAASEREAAQRQLKNGGFEERDTYTAKQVASRCGTDAKTMRKFFRSAHSTVEPVGQGGRYEFAAKDFPKIKREFDAWQKRAASRSTRGALNTPARKALQEHIKKTKSITEAHTEREIAEAKDEVDETDWSPDAWGTPIERDPTPEELEALDSDLDLDDLDAEDE